MKQSIWHEVPLVRLLIPFICGVTFAMFHSIHIVIVGIYFTASLIAFFIIPFVINKYSKRWYLGIAVLNLFFSLGILIHFAQNQLQYQNHFSHVKGAKHLWIRLDEPMVKKPKSTLLKTTVVGCINQSGKFQATKGKLVVYLINMPNTTLAYGDIIKIDARGVENIPEPKNPFEFNYKRYLAFNQVYYRASIKMFDHSGLNNGLELMKFIYRSQNYFKQVIDTYITQTEARGIAEALLYGQDDHIDANTLAAYANTGTLHVLAVSGMHVGLIFYLLNMLLFFLNRTKKTQLIKHIIILICLWLYSALCGLSPSILRATVMISFMIGATMLNRKSNVYNTLAASALFILMFDVNVLANVGFQLSYLAVIGIVFIQPLIYKWYLPKTRIGNEIWKICAVSIAAQLTTSPIGMLYFHQFPNCFLFSNLLIIPITTLILYGCILLLICSKFMLVASYLGKAITYTIVFTNNMVKWVEKIPYAYVNGIEISIQQSIILYVFGFSLIYFFIKKETKALLFSLAALAMFAAINLFNLNQLNNKNSIWIYAVQNDVSIGIYGKQSGTIFLTDSLRNNKEKFRFHIQQHLWNMKIIELDTLPYNKNNWLYVSLFNKDILVAGNTNSVQIKQAQVLILHHPIDIKYLERIKPKTIVFTGHFSRKSLALLMEYCQKKGINTHNTQKSGAFELLL